MKITINNTLKQSADTMVDIAQLLSPFADKREGLTYHLTEDVTSRVTDGVTSRVTEDVTFSDSEKEGPTHCFSIGCKLGYLEGVTFLVTLIVTTPVTEKEEKKQKKKKSPLHPLKKKKIKKEKNTHTNAHACKKNPRIMIVSSRKMLTLPIETKNYNVMRTIHTRRTIRKYRSDDISEELLHRLLAEASRTQTMGNLQLYSVVVTRDAEMKARLAPAHFNQPMVTEAPVVLTICADFRRTTDWCMERSATPGYDNFLSFINAATDALLFTQTFCNLAEEEGLGCCYLGTTVYMPDSIIDTLHLPQLVMPVATLTLGWPAEEPPLTDRLAVEAFVHEETYAPYTRERIDAFYAAKESLEENKHFVALNGKETLAQVFTDCRYTKADNEAMSSGLLKALARQGFLPTPCTE